MVFSGDWGVVGVLSGSWRKISFRWTLFGPPCPSLDDGQFGRYSTNGFHHRTYLVGMHPE